MAPVTTAWDAIRTCGSAAPLPVRLLRATLRLLLWLIMRATMRVTVEGNRRDGPAVIVSNHPNLIDGLLVLMADPSMRPVARWHRHALVRAGLWVGNCMITTTGTPVEPHRGAFLQALTHLNNGGRVWIAPEGGWQPQRELRSPRTGAVRLAQMAGVPLQVLAIRHEPHPGPDVGRWPVRTRPAVTLRWGPRLATNGDMDGDIDRVMSALAATAGMTWNPTTAAGPDALPDRL
jgi:1-acyl-sn-glycerol-3-phosphate acyltransferase